MSESNLKILDKFEKEDR